MKFGVGTNVIVKKWTPPNDHPEIVDEPGVVALPTVAIEKGHTLVRFPELNRKYWVPDNEVTLE